MIYLLVGLPDCIVIEEILPRLPWYARPVCRAVSRLWRTTIDSYTEGGRTRVRQYPLLTGSSIISVTKSEPPKSIWSYAFSKLWKSPQQKQRRVLLIRDSAGHLRKLPPVEAVELPPGAVRLAFWNCVWTVVCKITVPDDQGFWRPERDQMLRLDIGAGNWIWESFPVENLSAWSSHICLSGSIYASPTIAKYHWDDLGISFNGDVFSIGLLDRRWLRRDPVSRMLNWFTRLENEGALYKVYHQVFDMYTHSVETTGTSIYESAPCFLRVVRKAWDGLHAQARLIGISVDSKCLLAYDYGLVWKVIEATLPQEGWSKYEYPRFLRGDSFVPPLDAGFNIVIVLTVFYSSNDYNLAWCNTRSSPVWQTIENIASGLESTGLDFKFICARDGKLTACLCSSGEYENEVERQWYVFHGVDGDCFWK